MITKYKFRILAVALLLIMATLYIAIDYSSSSLSPLSKTYPKEAAHEDITPPIIRVDSIIKKGVLRIATRNAPTTYYQGPLGPKGFEYDLVKDFANYLNVDLEVVVYDSIEDILAAVKSQQVDLAAAGITKTNARLKSFIFGPTYQEIKQQVVCNREHKTPKKVSDLIDRDLHVISQSSYVERLKELAKDNPELKWTEHKNKSTEELIHEVANGTLGCLVSDSNIVKLNQRYFPNLKTGLSITDKQSLAWVLHKDSDTLKQVLNDWFVQYKELKQLSLLEQHYYYYVPIFDYVNIRALHRRIDSRLPKYQPYFKQAAEQHDLNWVLLAAQSYQESHWNPRAKSPTGVRGMMMLTLPTAKQVGVKSRIDAEQSITGGAEYMSSLIKRLPEAIPDQTRMWYGLAAYNIGMGHLYDARNLATTLGKNPNSWRDMQEVLPLLAKKKYYTKLRYGYARGSEPVEYVKRVRHYNDILNKQVKVETIKPGVPENAETKTP